jgi:hypothetical protein
MAAMPMLLLSKVPDKSSSLFDRLQTFANKKLGNSKDFFGRRMKAGLTPSELIVRGRGVHKSCLAAVGNDGC